MPTETYARLELLEDKLEVPDDTVSDADLQALLEEGHRAMEAAVGKNFTEKHRFETVKSNGEDLKQDAELQFRPIFRVDEVERLDTRELVDSSDFSVDNEAGTVTFDASFLDEDVDRGDVFAIQYVPLLYRDLEIWYAVLKNKAIERVQFEESEEAQLYENAAAEAGLIEKKINSRVGPGSAFDGRIDRGTK